MKISEFLRLVRFEHAIMLAIAVFIGETVVLGHIPQLTSIPILLSLLVPIFSEMGSFALNDYLDIESDKLNKKTDRPLVSGTVSPGFAFSISWIFLLTSIILAFFINTQAFLIAATFNILAIAYNYKLKDLPIVGNLYIAFTMGIPFIFGNFIIYPELRTVSIVLAALGFVSGLAREIVKSAQDMKGDILARKASTLPILIGKKYSLLLAILFYILFIPLSYLPFSYGLKMQSPSLALVFIGGIGVLYNTLLIYKAMEQEDKSEKDYLKKARNISLISLFIGLIGYLIAVI